MSEQRYTIRGMPRSATSTHVVVQGHLTGQEVFEWGFWFGAVADTLADQQTFANTWRDLFQEDVLDTLTPLITTDCGYDSIRVYGYLHPTGPADFVTDSPITGGVGTGVGAGMPLQVAGCVTLRTALAGRRHRGRLYLPINNAGVLASHQTDSSHVDGITDDLATWFNHMNAGQVSGGGEGGVCVISQVAGVATPVTLLTMDTKLDVQRRRAASQIATATGSATVTPAS